MQLLASTVSIVAVSSFHADLLQIKIRHGFPGAGPARISYCQRTSEAIFREFIVPLTTARPLQCFSKVTSTVRLASTGWSSKYVGE